MSLCSHRQIMKLIAAQRALIRCKEWKLSSNSKEINRLKEIYNELYGSEIGSELTTEFLKDNQINMDDDTDTDTYFEEITPMSNKQKFSWLIFSFFVLDIFLFYAYTNPMSPVCLLIAEMGILFHAARELLSAGDSDD